jgi:NADH:ubiquinone oxidoreductase subunit 3 (subunit A)
MLSNLLISPPVAFIIFFVIVFLGNRFISKHASKGLDHPEKHLPYSGGQDIPPVEVRLSYESFFRLALLFGIAHVAVIILALISLGSRSPWLGLLYLAGVSISVFVLAHTK